MLSWLHRLISPTNNNRVNNTHHTHYQSQQQQQSIAPSSASSPLQPSFFPLPPPSHLHSQYPHLPPFAPYQPPSTFFSSSSFEMPRGRGRAPQRRSPSSSSSRSRSRSRHRRSESPRSSRSHSRNGRRSTSRRRSPRYTAAAASTRRSAAKRRPSPSHSHSSSPRRHSHGHDTRRSRRGRSASYSPARSKARRGDHRRSSSYSHSKSPSRRRPRSNGRSLSKASSSSSSRSSGSQSSSRTSGSCDDEEGMVSIPVGSVILRRYEVLSVAGQGTFGTVLDVYDRQDRVRLALKVVRSVPRYLEAAQVEVEILEKLKAADRSNTSLCVRFVKTFRMKYKGQTHVVLAFEKLGRSLYDFIKKNAYRGFSLKNVAEFGYQLLRAIEFCHSQQLIHTDLKPENILLRHSDYRIVKNFSRYRDEQHQQAAKKKQDKKSRGKNNGHHSDSESDVLHPSSGKSDDEYREPLDTDIRLIDFGGATFDHEYHSRIVNTRQYRAPEIILGCGWSFPSDLWSIGCILPELYSGELLFSTHEDLEHLALMQTVLEKQLPESIATKALEPYEQAQRDRDSRRGSRSKRGRRNGEASKSRSPTPREETRGRSSSTPRADLMLSMRSKKLRWPEGASSEKSLRTVQHAYTLKQLLPDADFLDLIRRLLEYDPAKRITATQALQHPFFREVRQKYQDEWRAKEQAAAANPSSSSSSAAAAAASGSSSSSKNRRQDTRARSDDEDEDERKESDDRDNARRRSPRIPTSRPNYTNNNNKQRRRSASSSRSASAPRAAAASSSSRRR